MGKRQRPQQLQDTDNQSIKTKGHLAFQGPQDLGVLLALPEDTLLIEVGRFSNGEGTKFPLACVRISKKGGWPRSFLNSLIQNQTRNGLAKGGEEHPNRCSRASAAS